MKMKMRRKSGMGNGRPDPMFLTIDIASLSDKAERINITLPSRVLRRIDQAAKAAGESRSGYIARRALA